MTCIVFRCLPKVENFHSLHGPEAHAAITCFTGDVDRRMPTAASQASWGNFPTVSSREQQQMDIILTYIWTSLDFNLNSNYPKKRSRALNKGCPLPHRGQLGPDSTGHGFRGPGKDLAFLYVFVVLQDRHVAIVQEEKVQWLFLRNIATLQLYCLLLWRTWVVPSWRQEKREGGPFPCHSTRNYQELTRSSHGLPPTTSRHSLSPGKEEKQTCIGRVSQRARMTREVLD